MGLALGYLQVEQSAVAIKEVFGKYDDVHEPGFHCVPWFFGPQIAGYLCIILAQLSFLTKYFIFHPFLSAYLNS